MKNEWKASQKWLKDYWKGSQEWLKKSMKQNERLASMNERLAGINEKNYLIEMVAVNERKSVSFIHGSWTRQPTATALNPLMQMVATSLVGKERGGKKCVTWWRLNHGYQGLFNSTTSYNFLFLLYYDNL